MARILSTAELFAPPVQARVPGFRQSPVEPAVPKKPRILTTEELFGVKPRSAVAGGPFEYAPQIGGARGPREPNPLPVDESLVPGVRMIAKPTVAQPLATVNAALQPAAAALADVPAAAADVGSLYSQKRLAIYNALDSGSDPVNVAAGPAGFNHLDYEIAQEYADAPPGRRAELRAGAQGGVNPREYRASDIAQAMREAAPKAFPTNLPEVQGT